MQSKPELLSEMMEVAFARHPADARGFVRELSTLANLPAHRVQRLERELFTADATRATQAGHLRTELEQRATELEDTRAAPLEQRRGDLRAWRLNLVDSSSASPGALETLAASLKERAAELDKREAALELRLAELRESRPA